MELKDKKIFITGGSSGIGASLVENAVNLGAEVFFTYHKNAEGASEVIKKTGDKAHGMQLSFSNSDDVKKVIQEARSVLGGIDILINNAGRYVDGDEWDGEYQTWVETLSQNLLGAMEVSKNVASEFIDEKKGIIVNVASVHGVHGQYEEVAYGASKAGIINLTQAYAKLLAPFGRANSVSPCSTNTGYWRTAPKEELDAVLAHSSTGRLVEVDEVVKVILFLISDESSMVTGQNIIIGADDLKR